MRFPRLTVALVLSALGVVVACAKDEPASERCTPKKESYCRCQDTSDGVKTCRDDGTGFGACQPCPNDTEIVEGDDTGPIGDDVPSDDDDDTPAPGGCGDGKIDPNEECDDTNKTDNDGCSPSCTISGSTPETGACPATPVDLWTSSSFDVDTSAAKKSFQSAGTTGECPKGSASPDRAYLVTMHKKGSFAATTSGANFDNFIYLIKTTDPAICTAVEAVCKNDKVGTGIEGASVPVEDGDKYFVVIDGVGTNVAGKLTLSLTLN